MGGKKMKALELTPSEVVGKAIQQIKPELFDLESQEAYSIVSLRVLETIDKKGTLDNWEYQSVSNMVVYLKGSVKNVFLDIRQDPMENLDTQEVNDIPDTEPEGMSNNWLVEFYKSLNYDTHKDLFVRYFINEDTQQNISDNTGLSQSTVSRYLTQIKNSLFTNDALKSLVPSQNLWSEVKRQGKTHIKHSDMVFTGEYTEKKKPVTITEQSLTTHLGKLKKYRRTQDPEVLTEHRDQSETALSNQVKVCGELAWPSCEINPTCNLSYDDRDPGQVPTGQTFKTIHPHNRFGRLNGEPITYRETWNPKRYLRLETSKVSELNDRPTTGGYLTPLNVEGYYDDNKRV